MFDLLGEPTEPTEEERRWNGGEKGHPSGGQIAPYGPMG